MSLFTTIVTLLLCLLLTRTFAADPVFTLLPSSDVAIDEDTSILLLSVETNHEGATYRWYFNDEPIDTSRYPSAASNTLAFTASPGDAGRYKAIATSSAGSATSPSTAVTVPASWDPAIVSVDFDSLPLDDGGPNNYAVSLQAGATLAGGAVSLDGTTSYVDLTPAIASHSGLDRGSVSLWAYWAEVGVGVGGRLGVTCKWLPISV
jgi:hypothetical protein